MGNKCEPDAWVTSSACSTTPGSVNPAHYVRLGLSWLWLTVPN